MSQKSKKVNYEHSVAELEAVIRKMEQGDLSLEDSLQCFEEGIHLSRECQKLLTKAEQRVTLLTMGDEENFFKNE